MKLTTYARNLGEAETPIELQMQVKAVSKQRPRTGKGGHMFTPKQTREFEKRIRTLASTITAPPYACPVRVYVHIMEDIPKSYKGKKRLAAELGLITPPRGDLDNKVKAITDALNGVAYLDDVQIADLQATKAFGDGHKIFVRIQRCGLSIYELEQFDGSGYDNDDLKGSAKVG